MDYYLCMQVLLKRPIYEQWPFPRCPNIKIALQLLFAEPVTVYRAAAEPASCPGARGAGHRPPLTAPPAPPHPRAPLPTGPRHVPGGPSSAPNPAAGAPFPEGWPSSQSSLGILPSRSIFVGARKQNQGTELLGEPDST